LNHPYFLWFLPQAQYNGEVNGALLNISLNCGEIKLMRVERRRRQKGVLSQTSHSADNSVSQSLVEVAALFLKLGVTAFGRPATHINH
jgi:hypothetical protein